MSRISKRKSPSRMCSMFWSDPVSRLSTQTTRWPFSSRWSQRWEPRKPAPPVTSEVGIGEQGYREHDSSFAPGRAHPRSGEGSRAMEAYTIPDAARVTGLSPREIRVRIEAGRLRATWRGGRRMLDRDELERAAMLADDGSSAQAGGAAEPIPELGGRPQGQARQLGGVQRAGGARGAARPAGAPRPPARGGA